MKYYHYAYSLAHMSIQDGWLLPTTQGDFYKKLLFVTTSTTPVFCNLSEKAIWGDRDPKEWHRTIVTVKRPLLKLHFTHASWFVLLNQCMKHGLDLSKLTWTTKALKIDNLSFMPNDV